ncbi:hypothetical protein GCM10027343_40850 [Noviherbaspirillum agri]
MNVTNLPSLPTSIAAVNTKDEVSIAVLRKALDMQVNTAANLLEAIPTVGSANLPPHLGQNINTTA